MAVLPCKRVLVLVLVFVFVLLCCFLNTTIAARCLGVPQIKNNNNVHNNQKEDGDLRVHGEEHFTNTDDLVTMDYTPASRKPPIHN